MRARLARDRLAARAWSQSVADHECIDRSAAFCRAALDSLARAVAPGVRLSAPDLEPAYVLEGPAVRLATAIGGDAATLPPAEGLHVVTSLYPALLPAGARSARGAFYTPPALTDRLLDAATEEGTDWRSARVLDPAAGGGAFLLGAADRMRVAMRGDDPAAVLARIGAGLLGLEIDAHAAGLAQNALEILLADLASASGRPVPAMVRVCDTLETAPEGTFDLVVGNPPYGRVALSTTQRRRYARSLHGHANLYGVFTDIALRWARAGGLIAYLTPTSFLAGRYYSALRGVLAAEAPPLAIDFVHARRGVFEDVLQETLLAVYRKGAARGRIRIHHLHVADEREATIARNGTIGLPADATAPWLAPRERAHGTLVGRVETMRARLADWGYSVSTGPLVWNRFKDQLCDAPGGAGVHPLIWAEAVTADGRFLFRAQKKNHAPYFVLRPGDGWLRVEAACVLVQRTTAKEQARRLIAAELPEPFVRRHGGVVVENHLNMVRPHAAPAVPPAVVAAVLNSTVVDQVFRCISGSVAVSAFELEALPLPDAAATAMLARLVVDGAARDRIDAECARLYGIAA